MKFGKRLRVQMGETLPEWRDKFLSYKELKKRLKSLSSRDICSVVHPPSETISNTLPPQCLPMSSVLPEDSQPTATSPAPEAVDSSDCEAINSPAQLSVKFGGVDFSLLDPWGRRVISLEEVDFIQRLDLELDKFNDFFVDKEEDFVIKLSHLEAQVKEIGADEFLKPIPSDEAMFVKMELVAFHGELTLLLNYSMMNISGMFKILKKHDKRTGLMLRYSLLHTVMQQDFYYTDIVKDCVKRCNILLKAILKPCETPGGPNESGEVSTRFYVHPNREMHEMINRNTRAILKMYDELDSDRLSPGETGHAAEEANGSTMNEMGVA